ncbi:MAG: DEAD/DEAH box helicase family protein [Magnetococcales bacterium]|nr:DEAD/DEAH box helicase family protein [Magnetococcales bacterium]
MATNEAFARVTIDALLKDAGWNLSDGRSVRFEYGLSDGTIADYVLCDRHGRSMAVIEAKKATIAPTEAEGQAIHYATLLDVSFVFLANGREIWFKDREREAHPREVKTFFSQMDLERRVALRQMRVDPLTIPIDTRIAGRDYQKACIDVLCQEIGQGRRKLLVEMATGTGKTRMAVAFIKRLFQANRINRVLFLVDRIELAGQAEDAFTEHLPDYPTYVLRAGRRFQDEKRITITTLQSMVNIYGQYSSGYFDLVISDECHRSIYGKWSGVLKHFDGIQLGLTATPCIVPPEVLEKITDEEDRLFVRDTLRFFELDRPTYRYTLKEAIADGYLVRYQIYHAMTVRTAAEEGFEVKSGELDWMAMDPETLAEFEELFGEEDTILVDPNALERRFTIPERNRAMVREFRKVEEEGFIGTDGRRRAPMLKGKTIVFAVNKRHAETLARMFDEHYADRKPSPEIRYADFVVSGTGGEDTLDGPSKIRRFKQESFPRILVSVNMLDTGFDCPEVVNLVMARFTRSAILYQQMRGRGTRRADHIHKALFTIFDFVGVTRFHGDNEEQPQGGFVVSSSPRTGPVQSRKLLMMDVNDHIDPSSRGWVILDEDGNETMTEAGEVRTQELGMCFEEWFLDQAVDADQSRLLQQVGEQIRVNAATLERFERYRFVQPPFSYQGGIHYAERLFGGMLPLEEVLQRMNAQVFC